MTGEIKFSRIPARAAGLKLTASNWAVLHVICLHADKTGHAYPSLARIGKMAGILRNHVSRSTKRLEKLGLIRSERLTRGSGWANTRYQVLFGAADEVAPEMGPPGTEIAPAMVLGAPSDGSTAGTSDGALTYQSTNHETDPYQGKAVEGRLEVKGAGSTGDGAARCGSYVTNVHGHRICGEPTVNGSDRCQSHALRVVTA